MKKFVFISRLVGIVTAFLLTSRRALAQFLEPVGRPVTIGVIERTIEMIANSLIYVSMIIAVIALVWAGITYMTAGSNPTAVKAAQDRLKVGIIGAAIVLAVGVILNTIDYFVNLDYL